MKMLSMGEDAAAESGVHRGPADTIPDTIAPPIFSHHIIDPHTHCLDPSQD